MVAMSWALQSVVSVLGVSHGDLCDYFAPLCTCLSGPQGSVLSGLLLSLVADSKKVQGCPFVGKD